MGVYKKNASWWIDYYVSGRRYREKVGPSKALAETVLQKRRVEIAEGKFLDKKITKKVKFEDFANEYLEIHSKVNNKSWKKSDWTNLNVLKKTFSGLYLHEITSIKIERFKIERLKTVESSSVNRQLACLKCMFNKAIEWGAYAGDNPVKKVQLLKEKNQRLRFLEREEIVRLLSRCNSYLKPIVVIAINTGMRRGEILNLKWMDVDFRRGLINIYISKNSDKREIPMNEHVKTALIRHKKHPKSDFVFCKKDGEPIKDIKKTFFTALNKSGIKEFRFHDLRHTFASHLVMSGVDLNTVRELMGHKSLQMTLRYSHLSPSHKKRAVDVLGKRMDTIWTPEANWDENKASQKIINV
ncbi:MAG: site-specific integrase [Candidatus Omnitrophica bacterium]|nr:site-specific integrase [Candidatus Omnitrophota bacterium]